MKRRSLTRLVGKLSRALQPTPAERTEVFFEKNNSADRAHLCADRIVVFNRTAVRSVHHLHKVLVGEQINVSASLTIIRHTEKLDGPILPAESRPAT
jgi:hypothetical protein